MLPNNVYEFKRKNQIELNIYDKLDRDLGIVAEQDEMPFIFAIQSNLITQHFFIPDKEIPELTEKYIQIISEKLQFSE